MDAHQPAIQKMNTPVAAAVDAPTENSIDIVPTASDTGTR
jgi:hypothetical protein